MHELMGHSIASAGFAAMALGIFFGLRALYARRQRRVQTKIVNRAAAQMRQTGIFLKLGLNADPADVQRMQEQLKARGLYDGDPDGVMDVATLDAVQTLAAENDVDLDSEVLTLFDEISTDASEQQALDTAMDRLAESNVSTTVFYKDARDRLA